MASKLRAEFVRLRNQDSNGPQNQFDVSDQVPVTKAVSATALTGAGRITVPATCNGYKRFHVRLVSDVECLVTFAPAGNADTAWDAAAGIKGGYAIPANQPTLIPVTPGQLISAATGLSFA